jgi:hypothetical protein
MTLKNLDNLVERGMLKSEPGDQKEFDSLVDLGRKKLLDAANDTLAEESQFDLAYNAAHALSLAAMRWHGYRPDKQRYVVFQTLSDTLGLKPEQWRILDKSHQARNLAEYEGSIEVDPQLLAGLLEATQAVLNAVEKLGPVPKLKTKF